jgi:hypothetical protein
LRCRGWDTGQSLARRALEKRVLAGHALVVQAAHAAAGRVMWHVSAATG